MERETYRKCFYNGKKHIDRGTTLGDSGDFGTAITFFVIGIEELIKFLIIQMSAGGGKRFSLKEVEKLFSSHTEKHKLIMEFLRATRPGFAETFTLSQWNKIREIPLTPEQEEAEMNRFKEIGAMVSVASQSLTAEEVDAFILWLEKNANRFKNKGLYVDLRSSPANFLKSELTSPEDVTASEYQMVRKFCEAFLQHVGFAKDIDITEEEFIAFLNYDPTRFKVHGKRTDECSSDELNEFETLVVQGGQIDVNGLANRIKGCKLLAFCYDGDKLVGVSAIKNKTANASAQIRLRAGIVAGNVPTLELGYSFTHADYRRQGVNSRLNDLLLAQVKNEHIYATTAVKSMKNYLLEKGFKKAGHAFAGRFNEQLEYFER
jgi:AbiV family abortive infection protein